MLIDAGNNANDMFVVDYLKQQGATRLDYVVATHPHEDHIGGLDTVVRSMRSGRSTRPNAITTTKTFEDFLSVVEQKGLKLTEAKAGVTLDLGAGVPGCS